MSRRLLSLLLAALPVVAYAAPESYTFDSTDTFANFTVEHFGITPIYGRFNKTAGKMSMDRAAKNGAVDVVVDTASVDTGFNEKGTFARSRDEHLRSADFFNAAEFPKMTYKSTSVTFSGDAPKSIEGNLTLLGVTKPLTLTVERFKCNAAAGNNRERCGGVAVGKLMRSDFGMKRSIPAISDEITLIIAFAADKDA